ncbi:hypothetical protein SNOG_11838 [Parastagonospora nodorum SN15]|uniref:Uncharacterized protein n=1 Tax=Phaeosphaeria nodorum (strain SN15 / ATCC MYA-4574 / FGSC 10173) TaxID=321614 RepID=Q0U8S6_PHANO|nr:hypothetical protein SNOG_11838 [Parastagonospora nodorum SN15]EAT80882.2 hypothetical protein SNOG_11838 [Parastagonospora nodorum SN15]
MTMIEFETWPPASSELQQSQRELVLLSSILMTLDMFGTREIEITKLHANDGFENDAAAGRDDWVNSVRTRKAVQIQVDINFIGNHISLLGEGPTRMEAMQITPPAKPHAATNAEHANGTVLRLAGEYLFEDTNNVDPS